MSIEVCFQRYVSILMSPPLITGFGPFREFASNPSEMLARNSGLSHSVLDVSYEAADRFFKTLDPDSFESLIMIGLHGVTTDMRLETLAHNWTGCVPDILGEAPSGSVQDGAPILAGTLWRALPLQELLETQPLCLSFHPGSYLCNYVYYRALCMYPAKRIGFIHVPSERAMPLERQAEVLSALLDVIEKA